MSILTAGHATRCAHESNSHVMVLRKGHIAYSDGRQCRFNFSGTQKRWHNCKAVPSLQKGHNQKNAFSQKRWKSCEALFWPCPLSADIVQDATKRESSELLLNQSEAGHRPTMIDTNVCSTSLMLIQYLKMIDINNCSTSPVLFRLTCVNSLLHIRYSHGDLTTIFTTVLQQIRSLNRSHMTVCPNLLSQVCFPDLSQHDLFRQHQLIIFADKKKLCTPCDFM